MTTELKTAAMTPAAQKLASVKELLLSHRDQLAMALPKLLTPDRLIRVALTEIAKNPRLLECSPASLFGAVLQCAQLGLEPGVMGNAYLVPFRNHKSGGRADVQFLIGYKGLLALARRSGDISTIHAREVYEHDRFSYCYGLAPTLEHVPAPIRQRGEIVAAYAVARLKDGAVQFEAMTREEIDEHRDRYSKAAKEGPWVTNYREMALKTVLRRLCKLLPASTDLQTAIALDEQGEAQVPQGLAAVAGITEEEVRADDESDQAAQLADLQEKLALQRESGAAANSPEVAAPTQSRPSSDLVAPAPEDLPPTDAETLLHDYRKDLRDAPTLEGAVKVMNRAMADAALSADQKAELQKLLYKRREALMPSDKRRRGE